MGMSEFKKKGNVSGTIFNKSVKSIRCDDCFKKSKIDRLIDRW